MIRLFDNSTDSFIGEIKEEDAQILRDKLEEESPDDTDYYINGDTIDMLEEAGVSTQLLSMLREAIRASGEVEIRLDTR